MSSISGLPTQYAGGGGAGIYYYTTGITLGAAGAGNGGNGSLNGSYAVRNTGSGGGGSGSGKFGGNGASGIVILRYPSFYAPASLTTGSPEIYITGGWRVYEFIASGTIVF